MSAGGAFGGARGFQPRPPEKGVFPLDHFGECKQVRPAVVVGQERSVIGPCMRPGERSVGQQACHLAGCCSLASEQIKEQYLECLKEHGSDAEACRDLAKAYLQCRMERCARARWAGWRGLRWAACSEDCRCRARLSCRPGGLPAGGVAPHRPPCW